MLKHLYDIFRVELKLDEYTGAMLSLEPEQVIKSLPKHHNDFDKSGKQAWALENSFRMCLSTEENDCLDDHITWLMNLTAFSWFHASCDECATIMTFPNEGDWEVCPRGNAHEGLSAIGLDPFESESRF
ncbi:MAG: hypothetical protein Q9159_002113 [Coniocarpon cinnabarinum]